MSSKRFVPTSNIRTWAKTPEGTAALTAAGAPFPGTRGRVHPDTVKVFLKENPRLAYAEKVSEAPTFTVPVTVLDKAGRKTTVKRTLTNAEARAALGQVQTGAGKNGNDIMTRGRMSRTILSDVLSQAEANAVADQFTKVPA